MLPGRAHGAVVPYVRREFCLDCRAASALPLPSACGSLHPWPSTARGQLEESWQGLACWVLCGCSVVLVGRAPTIQHSQTTDLPC